MGALPSDCLALSVLPSTLRPSFDIESSLDPEVSGPKGRTKCGTEGQDEVPHEVGPDPRP